jgi:hypothetical protein
MTGSHPAIHLSSFDLEALRLGALAPERAAAVREHLAACRRCSGQEEELRGHREVFEREVLPRTVDALRARASDGGGRWRAVLRAWWPDRPRWLGLGLPLAAAAVMVLAAVRRAPAPSAEPPATALKGTASEVSFLAVARQGTRVFRLPSTAPLRGGDQVRFVVDPGPHRFLLVASVDGAGRANVYHPYGGRQSAPVTPYQRLEIPGSIVLDGAPGPERLYALYSDRPLAAQDVVRQLQEIGAAGESAIRQQHDLHLPGVQAQVSTLLEKERP